MMSTKRKFEELDGNDTKRKTQSSLIFLITLLQLPVEILLLIASFCKTTIPLALASKETYTLFQFNPRSRPSFLLLDPLLFLASFSTESSVILSILRVGLLTGSILADNVPHIIHHLKPICGDLFSVTYFDTNNLLPDEDMFQDFFNWSDAYVELDNYNLNWLFYGIAQDSFQLVLYYLKNNTALLTEENFKALIDICFFNRKWKCLVLFFSNTFHQHLDPKLRIIANEEYFMLMADEIFFEFEDEDPQITTLDEIQAFLRKIAGIAFTPINTKENKVRLESWDDHREAFQNLLDKLFEHRNNNWMVFALLCLFQTLFTVTDKTFVEELWRVGHTDPMVLDFIRLIYNKIVQNSAIEV